VIGPELLCLLMFVSAFGALLAGFPVAFTLAGTALLFALAGHGLGAFEIGFLSAFPQRVFAIMTGEVLVAVPLFVFMGVMLERSRVAEELIDTMGRLFGPLRGGLAFSVSVVGALLAASTGIVGATVVTMGLLSLPTMLRRGYRPAFACGSICAAGTLGQVIPPSIVLVLLGDQLSIAFQRAQFELGIFAPDTVSVNDLFAGALVPGLGLVLLYLLYQAAVAWLHPRAAPALVDEPGELPRGVGVREIARALVAPIALMVAVLGSILGGLASPTEAASVGALGALLLAGHRLGPGAGWPIIAGVVAFATLLALVSTFDPRGGMTGRASAGARLLLAIAVVLSTVLAGAIVVALVRTWRARAAGGARVLVGVMRSTMEIASMVFLILVGASMFSLVFRGFGGDEAIERILHGLPGGALGAMLVVMGVMFLLGFFLDFLEIVFIVVPIVAPVLLKMEVAPGVLMSPVWLGVMMAINLQTSFLTPPFGFSLFYLRGVAPERVRTVDIYRGVAPFVALQLLALGLLAAWPGLATWLPERLYGR